MDERLRVAVVERFVALNGDHPMTGMDDLYVADWYSPLHEIAARASYDVNDVARLVLAGKLPLPGYVLSDGTPMFQRDLLSLSVQAGGFDHLPEWFAAHYADPRAAVADWRDYLSGQLVCLKTVTPQTIQRKGVLVQLLVDLLDNPASTDDWLATLHGYVDELDALEPPFAPYDRLRFGGPVSRDQLIDGSRARYPYAAVAN